MKKILIIDNTGKKISDFQANKEINTFKEVNQTIFDSILSTKANKRQGTHKTKDKSEVRGGGKKPWRQKGTGRARQGSIRSPQWRGGGVVFGPTPEKNYTLKVNKKVQKKALLSVLKQRIINNDIVVLKLMKLAVPHTKTIGDLITSLKCKKPLFISDVPNINYQKSITNIQRADFCTINNLSCEIILKHDLLIVNQKAYDYIEGMYKNG